jgi:hypothetical protein
MKGRSQMGWVVALCLVGTATAGCESRCERECRQAARSAGELGAAARELADAAMPACVRTCELISER